VRGLTESRAEREKGEDGKREKPPGVSLITHLLNKS
jgi:hypothetical protein